MTGYFALIHKDATSSYGVTFPDLPGCVTAADTAQEALRVAQQVLAFHLAGMTQDGDAIPPPRSMDEILADPEGAEEAAGATWALIPAITQGGGKPMRLSLSLDRATLDLIDAGAAARGLTRSAFMTAASLRWIAQEGA
jgi:predicted RNase H-like HicB family nuclease